MEYTLRMTRVSQLDPTRFRDNEVEACLAADRAGVEFYYAMIAADPVVYETMRKKRDVQP